MFPIFIIDSDPFRFWSNSISRQDSTESASEHFDKSFTQLKTLWIRPLLKIELKISVSEKQI